MLGLLLLRLWDNGGKKIIHNMSQSRIAKILVLSLGKAISSLAFILTSIVLSRVLTLSEYAMYQQVMLVYIFAIPFLTMGLKNGIYYFLPSEKERVRGRVLDGILLLIGIGGLYMVFMFTAGSQFFAWRFANPELARLLRYMAPYTVFSLPVIILDPTLVVLGNVTQLTLYNILSRILLGIAVVASCLIWETANASLLGHLSMTIMLFFFAMWMFWRYTPAERSAPSLRSMKEMLIFSFPLGLASIIGTIYVQLDKMIVSSMCRAEQFAIYSNGAMELPLIGVVTGSIVAVLMPEFTLLHKQNKRQVLHKRWQDSVVKSSLLLYPVMVYCFILADEIVKVLFSSKYVASAAPFRLYTLLLLIRVAIFSSLETAAGRNKAVLKIFSVGMLMNTFLTVLFVKMLGYIGAVWATLTTSFFFSTPLHLRCISRILQIPMNQVFPFSSLGRVLLLSIVCAPILGLSKVILISDIWTLVVSSIGYTLIISVAFYLSDIVNIFHILSCALSNIKGKFC